MTKFEIGDRVKCVEGHTDDLAVRLIAGQVYTVRAIDSGQYISIDDDKPGWMVDRFELYAKAGEFVAGDVLFALYADGPLSVVNAVRASEDGQRVEFSDDLGHWWPASGYRLATLEEIAASDAAQIIADYANPKNFDSPLLPMADRLKALDDLPPVRHPDQHEHLSTETMTLLLRNGFNPGAVRTLREGRSTMTNAADFEGLIKAVRARAETSLPSAEIPAAEFDFATIKAGDELVLRYKVLKDGVDKDGFVMVHQPDFGGYYFRPSAFSSVIPAPKPKTLRERAIEAAMGVAFADNRAETIGIVDAVLAEVEKGQ